MSELGGAVARDSRPSGLTLALRERASTALPGAYAWAATVAGPAFQTGTSTWARLSALSALGALVSGLLLLRRHPILGRALGVFGFVGWSLLTWLLLGEERLESRDPFLAALGAVAFMLYALGWGSLRHRGVVPEDDPEIVSGTPLVPRSRQPVIVPIVLALVASSALVPTFLAFGVRDRARGLFAHAVAVLAAIVLITVGSRVALNLGQQHSAPPVAERLNAAAVPLALLALAFGLGFLWLVVR